MPAKKTKKLYLILPILLGIIVVFVLVLIDQKDSSIVLPNSTNKPSSSPSATETPSQNTTNQDYLTSAGKKVSLDLLNFKDDKLQEISFQRNQYSFIKTALAAESKTMVIDFSRTFSATDSFYTLATRDNKNWLLGGGTNRAVNLYSTNFTDKIENLATKLPSVHQNSYISSIATDGNIYLIGFFNGASESAQIFSYDGKTFEDLSSKLAPPEDSKVTVIKAGNHSFLITVHTKDINSNDNKIYRYTNGNFEDLSGLFPDGKKFLKTIEYNGKYWLLGGAYYAGGTKWTPTLYKFDGTSVEDLSSNIVGKGKYSSVVNAISWNGQKFLIGGDDQGRDANLPTYGGLLYEYNGKTFKNLSDKLEIQYITAIANDGKNFLIGGHNWAIYKYDGSIFDKIPVLGQHASGVNVVQAIAYDGSSFIAVGYQSLVLKIKFL